jgi:gliding motility-associated-like protein
VNRAFFILLLILAFRTANATHIVGGELNYKHLGAFNYEIRLTVYRDCYTGIPPFDNPAALGIFDMNHVLLQNIMLPFVQLDTLPPTISDPCTIPPTDFCYEVTTYVDTLYLPPIPGGYQLAYQRCCRNQNILNIVNPLSTGATYYAHIPDTSVVMNDSNPVFKNWPPPFICALKPLVFDHSAIDYDGDSLVYELWQPNEGADQINPMPQPPNNPPYNSLTWLPPYSTSNMLGGTALSINPQTGLLTATPNTLGYFVIGVKVKEYRNGVLIGETLRDFQFIVKNCPSMVVAAATVPNVVCGLPSVTFTNNSQGGGNFHWDFGVPGINSDTSNLVSPAYAYPSSGTFTATLIAYAPNTPACNDTTTTVVSISNNFASSFTYTFNPCDAGKVTFEAQVNAPPGTTANFTWNLGDGNTSSAPSFDYYYQNAGSYTVLLSCLVPGGLNCADTSSAQVIEISDASQIFIPNAFTPNNDGVNDVFRARGPDYEKFYLAIYNRWGELIFESERMKDGWDGKHRGKEQDPGVYGYYLKTSCDGNNEIFQKGNFTLVR